MLRGWRGRTVRALATIALCAALLPATPAGAAGIDAYRGLGAWVDIFDEGLYGQPEATVEALRAHGVRTLFLQSATYRFPGPIRFPDLAGRFIDAAHAAGMRVVAWYVPDFADLERDLEWSLAAVNFTSPGGNRFDSFALDIEVTEVEDPNERASRLLDLSQRIRAAVGTDYPLGAITPSPLRSPGYWPVFPDPELAAIYDVYLPMAYWSYHANGQAGAYDYIARSAAEVRADTGRPDVPIHMIGGLADGSEEDESRGFVEAVNQASLIGASLYDAASSGAEDWTALAALRFADSAPEPAPAGEPEPEPEPEPEGLRLGTDLGTYGSVQGADRRFEREVRFGAAPMSGAWELDYEVFGLRPGEGELLVNGERVAALGGGASWSTRTTRVLPDEVLSDNGDNEVVFRGGGTWAVRRVTASAPPLPLEDRAAHGAIPQSDPGRGDRVTYAFASSAAPLVVTVRGFDVAPGEVLVVLDGRTVGWLPATMPGIWGDPVRLVLEPSAHGEHRLTFDAVHDGDDPWAVRVDASASAVLA